MAIFRKYYQSCAPFCSSNLLNFWFPDDNLWAKSKMCGMSFRHFLLKLLQNNFNIWTYKVTLALEDPWPTAFYFIICKSHILPCIANSQLKFLPSCENITIITNIFDRHRLWPVPSPSSPLQSSLLFRNSHALPYAGFCQLCYVPCNDTIFCKSAQDIHFTLCRICIQFDWKVPCAYHRLH
jgi:hypothetical protein